MDPRKVRPSFPGASFDVVVIGASVGGLGALDRVRAGFPGDFPAAIVIVQHLDPRRRSLMAEIPHRYKPSKVVQAAEGNSLARSALYIAPPNRHLLAKPGGTLALSRSELVHFAWPPTALLFESGAAACADRAIAVVLTGSGSDGSVGV